MAGYAKPDALVETDWLEEHVKDPGIRVIEVDEDTEAYEKGHIDGAVGWNWTTDLHAEVGRDYVDQAELSELLSAAGVGTDTTVILYGGNNNWFAAYAYWVLKLRGFDNVKLLNGGRKKWELESRQLTQEPASVTPTGFSISGTERGEIRALRDEVLGKVGGGDRVRRRPLTRGVPRREARARPPSAGAGAGARAHPRRGQHPVGQGGERGRDVQERGRAEGPVRGRRHHRRPRDHRVLPDRRALEPHVVRPAGAARVPERQELRRLVDRVRLARRARPSRRWIRPGNRTIRRRGPACMEPSPFWRPHPGRWTPEVRAGLGYPGTARPGTRPILGEQSWPSPRKSTSRSSPRGIASTGRTPTTPSSSRSGGCRPPWSRRSRR